jgi:S-formylglutathione hydrolase FrmB
MGLTSGSFAALTFVLAGVGLVLVIACWPLAARHRARHILARFAMVVLSQALVIAAFLVYLNGYFGFYASWSQLLGSGTPHVVGISRSSNPNAPLLTIIRAEPGPPPGLGGRPPAARPTVAEGRGGGGLLGTGRLSPAQTGELLEVSISGEDTGIAVTGSYVYLPPQYFQPAYSHARFPVLLALSGYPGSASSLIKLRLSQIAAGLVREGAIRPAVEVMMNSSVAMPRDTECTNIPAGPQVETFFAEDVPLAIEHAFRVQSGPGGWGTLGYSTGGFCAVKIAMLDPDQFPFAVSLAGYYQALQDKTTGDLYGGSTGYQNENSPDWRLQHLPAPPVSVLVTSSVQGELTYGGTVHFVSLVRPPMRVYTLYLPQGGHNFGTWDRELPAALRWLSERLTPARPGLAAVANPTASLSSANPHKTRPAGRPRPKRS